MLRNDSRHSDFVNDLGNMEINFIIPFGFLIKGTESKFLALSGQTHCKEF